MQDGEPEVLWFDRFAGTAWFRFVLIVQFFKFLSPAIRQARRFVRAEQAPGSAGFYAFHEQVGDPHSIKEVSGSQFILAMVLTEVQESEYIGMPGFQVDGESAFAFAAALIYITGGIIEHAQHGDDAVAGAVGASDIGAGGADIMNREPDAACALGDLGCLFEGIVDSVDAVILHGEQEATA